MRPSPRNVSLAAVSLMSLLAACASTSDVGEAEQESMVGQIVDEGYDESERMVCRRQRVIGSNVPRTVCKSEAQLKAEREAAEKAVGPLRPMTGFQGQRDHGQDPR